MSEPWDDVEGDADGYAGRPVGPHHFCEVFIEVGDPWAGTYCKLLAGHDGPHSALYPDEVVAALVCPVCKRPMFGPAERCSGSFLDRDHPTNVAPVPTGNGDTEASP